MKKIESSSYKKIVKESQKIDPSSVFNNNEDNIEEHITEKPSKDYFANIGVRIRVVPQKDNNEELRLAEAAFKEIRDQIQNGVSEDLYEAWLNGYDEMPKTTNQLLASNNNKQLLASNNIIIKTATQTYDAWDYKQYKCRVDLDYEYDENGKIENVKAFHYVKMPDGKEVLADISPYDKSRETLESWIDMGFPSRKDGEPFRK